MRTFRSTLLVYKLLVLKYSPPKGNTKQITANILGKPSVAIMIRSFAFFSLPHDEVDITIPLSISESQMRAGNY
jgi:hypothetical protein